VEPSTVDRLFLGPWRPRESVGRRAGSSSGARMVDRARARIRKAGRCWRVFHSSQGRWCRVCWCRHLQSPFRCRDPPNWRALLTAELAGRHHRDGSASAGAWPTLVVVEATGGLEQLLVIALAECGMPGVVVCLTQDSLAWR